VRTVAIIQARMGSGRCPGKVMAEVGGRPMLDHVVRRAQQATTIELVVVATSDRPSDDAIADFCAQHSISCIRGSEDDVLDRYYQASKAFDVDPIVRLTADCPLLDPAVIDSVVRTFRAGDYDYVSNALEPTYPDGLDTEVFGFGVLEKAWREASRMTEREYPTSYIFEHPTRFRLHNVRNDVDLSNLRWTVDEPKDLEFVRRIYGELGPEPSFGMQEILDLLRRHPELATINAGIGRNEGYQRSLEEDAATGRDT